MSDKNQRLVLSIIEFLNASMESGAIKADDKEGLEVAVQCIGEAFGVDPSDQAQVARLSVKPQTLPSIFDVYLKTREKIGATPAASSSTPAATAAASSSIPKTPAGPTAEDKAKAEKLKQAGNAAMSKKSYDEAIKAYTEAVALDPKNPVYYSNRAAAYSSIEDHDKAIEDAEKALEVDPAFIKAYSRLGHAYYSKEDYASAIEAFEDGLKLDPTNANFKSGLENAKQRAPQVSTRSPPPGGAPGAAGMPDLSALAGMFGGGGGRGGGGMPDLASLMSNPALMSMAQNMMANGGMERLMQNPALRNMAQNLNSGGGMPDMSEIMSNPELANLASTFMGGQGRGAGGPPPGGA